MAIGEWLYQDETGNYVSQGYSGCRVVEFYGLCTSEFVTHSDCIANLNVIAGEILNALDQILEMATESAFACFLDGGFVEPEQHDEFAEYADCSGIFIELYESGRRLVASVECSKIVRSDLSVSVVFELPIRIIGEELVSIAG